MLSLAPRTCLGLPSARIGAACAAISFLLASSGALAGPAASVRVRGSARLEANAVETRAGVELRGMLSDDAGKAVPRAWLRVRLRGSDGALRLLPHSDACDEPERVLEAPFRGAEEVLAKTDAAGRFCLRWPAELPDGRLTVQFDDASTLLDPTELAVVTERVPPLELAFTSVPQSVAIEQQTFTLILESRTRRAGPSQALPFTLEWSAGNNAWSPLASRQLVPGGALRLTLPTRAIGAAAAGELRATLGHPGRQAQSRAPLLVTAQVELSSQEQLTASSNGEGALDVKVNSVLGPVNSGSVEALLAGRTVGIATVQQGVSRLNLALGSVVQPIRVDLRYLSGAPWFIPGAARQISVEIAAPSPWRKLPWAVSLLVVGAWLLAAWRRPQRVDRPATAKHGVSPAAEPAIAWLAPDRTTGGWTGRVRDAHDSSGVGTATVSIVVEGAVLFQAISDEHGEFRIEAEARPRGGSMRIEAPWHATLERALPPPGRVDVALLTRRRFLLSRLVDWASRRGAPFSGTNEPTPGELAGAALGNQRHDIVNWARAVEVATFGPDPLDSAEEARIRALEPDSHS